MSKLSHFLGLDFSTQQLKGVIINNDLEILHQANVQFGLELPEFRTQNGINRGTDNKTVTAPVLMWVKALDLLLDKLSLNGADFSQIAALSGTAQQHGTVYWATGSEKVLENLVATNFLHTQLASCFSVTASPIWMDSSTKDYCERLEKAIGGPMELAKLTGSTAYERFSAAQIAKIADTKKLAYNNTERISLVSSFGCSLFLGKYAPIDWSDGSGMNLLDIQSKKWIPKCLDVTAPDLEKKLGTPVPSSTVVGNISKYFVERFSFSEECKVVAFTGDNPASLAGMCLKEKDMAVSLGTSDTVFLWLPSPSVFPEGHILINPVSNEQYMALLCFKNGSLTRMRIRDRYGKGSWDEFNTILDSIPKGNLGYFGLYFDAPEIIPKIMGEFRWDPAGNKLANFPLPELEVRALLEGQFVAKKAHALDLGFVIDEKTRIIATGGASKNIAILQILADVFGAPVYVQDEMNSAVVGSAYRAKHALEVYELGLKSSEECGDNPGNITKTYNEIIVPSPPVLVCSPSDDAHEIYDPLVKRYKSLLKDLINETTPPAPS